MRFWEYTVAGKDTHAHSGNTAESDRWPQSSRMLNAALHVQIMANDDAQLPLDPGSWFGTASMVVLLHISAFHLGRFGPNFMWGWTDNTPIIRIFEYQHMYESGKCPNPGEAQLGQSYIMAVSGST